MALPGSLEDCPWTWTASPSWVSSLLASLITWTHEPFLVAWASSLKWISLCVCVCVEDIHILLSCFSGEPWHTQSLWRDSSGWPWGWLWHWSESLSNPLWASLPHSMTQTPRPWAGQWWEPRLWPRRESRTLRLFVLLPSTQRLYVFTCKLLVEPIPWGRSQGQHGSDTALHLLRDSILHDKGQSFC